MNVGFVAPSVVVSGVSVRYGDHFAVKDASVEVGQGEIHVLLGESGSGKTSLLRAIAGLERLAAGCIRMHTRVVDDASRPGAWVPPEARAIGFVFQDYALFPNLSVIDNVMFGRPADATAAHERLRQVGLDAFADRWPSELSGGQQQRVALARALATRPQVMLLDEPFSGVDKRLRRELRVETAAVLRSAGVAAIWVTHDVEEAFVVGDRLTVMAGGCVLQTDTAEQLYHQPVDATVALTIGDGTVLAAVRTDADRAACALGPVVLQRRREGSAPASEAAREGKVVVRPEQVRLDDATAAPAHAVSVGVTQRRYLGAEVELSLATPDGVLCYVRLPATDSLASLSLAGIGSADLRAWVEGPVPWLVS